MTGITEDKREVHWRKRNGTTKSYTGPGWNYYTSPQDRNLYIIVAPGGEIVAKQRGSVILSLSGETLFTGKNAWDALYLLVRSYTEL